MDNESNDPFMQVSDGHEIIRLSPNASHNCAVVVNVATKADGPEVTVTLVVHSVR